MTDENVLLSTLAMVARFQHLSTRERDVAKLLALGYTNREIAEQFHISIKTVDSHRSNAVKKLGVRNNVELARLALRAGFVDLAAQGYELKGYEIK